MKKQSILGKFNNPFVFITTVLIVTGFLFITLSPRVSSTFFPLKGQFVFNSFVTETKANNVINPRGFWEFREFYSPGYSKFSKDGINQSEVNNSLDTLKLNPKNVTMYFSKYDSNNLFSLDGLTSKSRLSQIFDNNKFDKKEVIFEDETAIIFESSQDQIYIIFILPITEMKKANGFFDYSDEETAKLLEDKFWLNITKIN